VVTFLSQIETKRNRMRGKIWDSEGEGRGQRWEPTHRRHRSVLSCMAAPAESSPAPALFDSFPAQS